MKLMIVIIRDSDSEPVIKNLVQNKFRVTRMSSSGGFLRQGNSTLLVGIEDEQVQQVMDLLRKSCCPPDAENQYRATAFVVNMPYSFQV